MNFIQFIFTRHFWSQFAMALVLSGVLIFLLLSWLSFQTNHGQEVVVPNVTNLLIEEVEDKLDNVDLDYVLLDTLDYDPTKPKFVVLFQEPKPGSKVKPNRKVYVKINAGDYAFVTVPDLVQKSFRHLENTFKVLGLQVGDTVYKPFLGKDMVLEMKYQGKPLKPGTKLKKTTKIDFVLGDGKISYYEDKELDSIQSIPIEEIEVPYDN